MGGRKSEIEKKLKQVKFCYKQLCKFKDRIFASGGLDEETGSYPMRNHLSSFLASSRSVLQYALEAAKEHGKKPIYDQYIGRRNIFKFFKVLRNFDIHEFMITVHTTIKGDMQMVFNKDRTVAKSKPALLYIEPLSDLDSPKGKNEDFEIVYSLSKKIKIDQKIIQRLEKEGKKKLADAAKGGEDLYEELEWNGITDMFELCEIYIKEVEDFITYGETEGFIV